MIDTNDLKEKIRTTIFPNGRGAINAADHQALLLDMADGMGAMNDKLNEVATDTESNNVAIEDLQENKVDHGSYAPDLSVGVADHLAGHDEPTPSEFTFRRSGGGAILSGNARVQSVKGNSVVWNNLVEGIVEGSQYGYKVSMVDRKVLIQNVSATTPDYGNLAKIRGFKPIAGHKYVLLADNQDIDIAFNSLNGFESKANVIVTAPDITYNDIYLRTNSAPSLSILPKGGSLTLRYVICDITKMFGAGNEPQTIDDFYSRIPQGIDMDAYNGGEVIHNATDKIESVGVNQWDEEWEVGEINVLTGGESPSASSIRSKNFSNCLPNTSYYLYCGGYAEIYYMALVWYDDKHNYISYQYGAGRTRVSPSNARYFKLTTNTSTYVYGTTYNHDICINLSDASINGKYFPYVKRMQSLDIISRYFPDGMMSAGNAHDEIRYNKTTQKWETVKRIGEVNMGNQLWQRNSDGRFEISILSANPSANVTKIGNVLCSKYVAVSTLDTYNGINGISIDNVSKIWVRDSAYTDVVSFKAAMQGVMLYYELANPIVTEIEEAFNLDYEVWNGGTEQAIADTPTSAFKADIIYGFNAYGVIKELREQLATLQAAIAKMNV